MHDEQNPIDDAGATAKPDGRARTGIIRSIAHWLAEDDGVLPDEGRLAPFDGATAWLNSEPLTPEDFAAGSSSSTSGPTPASTGFGRSRTSGHGHRSTSRRA